MTDIKAKVDATIEEMNDACNYFTDEDMRPVLAVAAERLAKVMLFRKETAFRPYTMRHGFKIMCSKCNKKLSRTVSTYYTMNPFNKLTHAENRGHCSSELASMEESIRKNGAVCKMCSKIDEKNDHT